MGSVTERLVTEYDTGETTVMHVDGVPWNKAKVPPRWHRCKVQSEYWLNFVYLTQRCACGGLHEPPGRKWYRRNERWRHRRGR